ncbi:hypothetical protein D3C75_1007730 [compost metagenome]
MGGIVGQRDFNGVLLHRQPGEVVLLVNGKFGAQCRQLTLAGEYPERALVGIFGGGDGDFTVPQLDGALMGIKPHIRRALGIERQLRAILQPLVADRPFGGAVVGTQAFAGLGLPELPASADAEQQHQPFHHLTAGDAGIVQRPAGNIARDMAQLAAQVFHLLPCPLMILVLLIPLLPALLLLRADALAA